MVVPARVSHAGGLIGERESHVAADDREPEREVANDGDADASGTDNADAPGQGEWDAYPLIVLVIVVTVLLTVFGLGPMLGATLLPGLVHH